MSAVDPTDESAALDHIRLQAANRRSRLSFHARREMQHEDITLAEPFEATMAGQLVENYPHHGRGACCLLYDVTEAGRDLHIVCTTTAPQLIIITVSMPPPPKWTTPLRRGR